MQLLGSGLGVMLKECFVMFPSLDTVTCTPSITNRLQELRKSSPFWDRMQSKILVTPKDWRSEGARSCSDLKEREVAHGVSFLIFEAMAFRASFSGTKPVTKLGLHIQQHIVPENEIYESWESVLTRRFSSSYLRLGRSFATNLNKILEGFQHLTHIDWCVCQSLMPGFDSASLAKDTARFLRGSRNLRSLCLSLYDRDDVPTRREYPAIGDATIKNLLAVAPDWPHIHHLHLRFRATCTGLLPLFRIVSPSLRSLELTDMEVGNAHELITQIPEILDLDKVQLKSIWHVRETSEIQCLFIEGLDVKGHFETGVKKFLLHDVEQCPDLGLE